MKTLFPPMKATHLLDDDFLNQNFLDRRRITDAWLCLDDLISILTLKTDSVMPNTDAFKKVMQKDDTVIKFWIDPTGSEIHLWHSIPINIARLLQATWKEITLVIGDFTAKIWDPTWRSSERKVLSDQDIENNYNQYKLQAAKFLNLDKTNVVYNSSMLSPISIQELTHFFQKVPMWSLMEREDFKKRIEWGHWLSLAEVFYPLLMALDSIKLKADLEIGGKDQLLNFHITRDLMFKSWLDPEVFITTPLLPWITGTGEKMSKSLNNYVWLLEDSTSIYGKIMSIPDNLLELYVLSFVDLQFSEKDALQSLLNTNPYVFKRALAYYISSLINGEENAKSSEAAFTRKFSKNDFNEEDFREIGVEKSNIVDALVKSGVLSSKAEARRLILAWAIRQVKNSSEFEKIEDVNFLVEKECYLKVWKKQFIKFIIL